MEFRRERISTGMIILFVLIVLYARFSSDSFLSTTKVDLSDDGIMFIVNVIKVLSLISIFFFTIGYMFGDILFTIVSSILGLTAYYVLRTIDVFKGDGFSISEDLFISLIILLVLLINIRIFSALEEYGYL